MANFMPQCECYRTGLSLSSSICLSLFSFILGSLFSHFISRQRISESSCKCGQHQSENRQLSQSIKILSPKTAEVAMQAAKKLVVGETLTNESSKVCNDPYSKEKTEAGEADQSQTGKEQNQFQQSPREIVPTNLQGRPRRLIREVDFEGWSSAKPRTKDNDDSPEHNATRVTRLSASGEESLTEDLICESATPHLGSKGKGRNVSGEEALTADSLHSERPVSRRSSMPTIDYNMNENRSRTRRRMGRRTSLSGSFTSVDGIDIATGISASLNSLSASIREGIAFDIDHTTSVEVVSKENGFSEDEAIQTAIDFEKNVLSQITDLPESLQLLRRTRTVGALASRLMGAPDEKSCFEEVTRLLLPLFHVDRASYALLTDPDNFIVKKVNVTKKEHAKTLGFEFADSSFVRPLKGTAVGICAETLEQHYIPRATDDPLESNSSIYSLGLNTVLATPILVNGNKFAGCIILSMEDEDAFKEHDRILVADIAAMLGANIYAKRLRQAAENANKISREMLHSIIPPKVLAKIECFWDESSDEYQCRKQISGSTSSSKTGSAWNSFNNSMAGSTLQSSMTSEASYNDEHFENENQLPSNHMDEIRKKINFLNEVNRCDSGGHDAGVMVDISAIDLISTPRALYAENAENVCIIFTDIVGFSKISMNISPIQVMDMLQDLFHRFDDLCDKYGVLKLETIGDAYLCSTGLMDGDEDERMILDPATRAIAMAKDMVRETQYIRFPQNNLHKSHPDYINSLQIRVGIHVGDVTFGVLGERMPKLTLFGNAVNMAARMEQTSRPNKIRVTRDFHDLVADVEKDWEEHKVISVKNMGEVDTYLLDPLRSVRNNDYTFR